MSDKQPEGSAKAEGEAVVSYKERSADEIKALEQTFRGSGANYVAQPAPGYDVSGLWHCFGSGGRTGYATHAIALHWILSHQLGITTELVPHRDEDVDIERFPEDRYDMLFGWMKSAVGVPRLLFASYPPEVAMKMDGIGPSVVPYCAFEGTKVSEMCRDICNGPLFLQVWVVSDSVRQALLAGGVHPDKVLTVRPPVCDGPWKMPELVPHDVDAPPPTQDRPYTFGVLGTWQQRKGMHDLVRAYFGTFERDDNVQLVIRTSAFSGKMTIRDFKEKLTEEIAAIAAEFGDKDFPASKKMPKLRFEIGTDATDQEIIEWLSQLDCYVNPSYGEGLGIPHIWAKANGVPMVSTGYGAVGDLLREINEHAESPQGSNAPRDLLEMDIFVPHRLEPVHRELLSIALMFDRETQWGVYDPAAFGFAMHRMFKRGPCRDIEGAEYVRKAFSVEACAPAVRKGLAGLLKQEEGSEWNL
jgi:glycosyltransferase involved in cell wall biosynthesis